MVDQQHVALEEAQPAELWPPDDTEESVLETNVHQTTIHNPRQGLHEIAARCRQIEQLTDGSSCAAADAAGESPRGCPRRCACC